MGQTETPPRPPDFLAAAQRALRQPTFLIVVGVLLIAAVGLNASVQFLKLHFKKESVELARELGAIPNRVGPWVQVSQDQALSGDIEDVLGTEKYVFRDYLDERVFGAGVADAFQNKSVDERRELVGQRRAKAPTGVISLSVTYYTGMVDTVAHIPDRCVTADGYEPRPGENVTVNWPIARDLPAERKPTDGGNEVEVRYINFEDQTGTSNVTRSISYFFHANGKFISSPLMVRRELADLFQKKAYYAKIECMTTIDDPRESARVQTDFLTHAMPEIVRCLPDWNKETGNAKPEKTPEKTTVAAK